MKQQPTINLYNQDCMQAMAQMPDNSYELAIVDPPYGIGFSKSNSGGHGWIQRESKDWDDKTPDQLFFTEIFRVSKDQIIWGGNYLVEFLPPSMGWIFWDKGQRNFSLADGELAFTSFNKALRVFDFARGRHKSEDDKSGGKFHPTQKPVALYKWILKNYASEGDKILDTHGGSMSIAIACHDMGFDLDLYEIDKDYFEAGKQRLETHRSQLQLF